MSDTPQHTWSFPCKGLKAIYDNEITGQLSDGAWENYPLNRHWYFWNSLKTQASTGWEFKFNPQVDFNDRYPKKNTAYNLTTLVDPDITDLSGRMRAYYVDGEGEFGLGQENVRYLIDKNNEAHTKDGVIKVLRDCKNEYFDKKAELFEKFDKFDEFRERYNAYTRNDLIADLRTIKKQMKVVIEHCCAFNNSFYK